MPKGGPNTREFGENLAIQALGFLAQDPERLNCEIFPEFPRVRAAFRHRRLPFRNVSPLRFY